MSVKFCKTELRWTYERRDLEEARRDLAARLLLRLTRALAVEIREDWIEATRYLNMEPLAEQRKERLRTSTAA